MVLSLISLASGTEANLLNRYGRTAVSVVATPFWNAMNSFSSGVQYVSGFFIQYHAAQNEAEELRGQLARTMPYMAELREVKAENLRLRDMLGFQKSESRLVTHPVEVKVIGKFEGTLIINEGSIHGVRESMCVMTPEGVVGIVTKVEPFQSLVYTLHHADCRIGAIIQRTRAHGVVQGSGSDFSYICRMEYIGQNEDVRVGDVVVSSGDAIFPKGFPIGRITALHGSESLLKAAFVEPFADPYEAEEVFLVERIQPSAMQLTGVARDEQDLVGGHPMPDDRPAQERYAP